MKPFFILLILTASALCLIMPVSAYYTGGIYPLNKTDPKMGPVYNSTVPGERNAGQWYEFTLLNVTGYQSVVYHYTVYDADIRDSYEYRSDAWGQWWRQDPEQGKKFLFVWLCGWSEGTSWLGWGMDRFFASVNGTMRLSPEPVQFSDIGRIRRGGAWSDKVPPRTIRWMENKTSFPGFAWSGDAWGFKDGLELDGQDPGQSNAMQGYLIFQIPRSMQLKDIQIIGWFGDWGRAWWNLDYKPYIQQSPEYQRILQKDIIKQQRESGLRVLDSPNVRQRG